MADFLADADDTVNFNLQGGDVKLKPKPIPNNRVVTNGYIRALASDVVKGLTPLEKEKMAIRAVTASKRETK